MIALGIVIERRERRGRWGGVRWRPVAVVPGGRAEERWELLREDGATRHFYAGPFPLRLHPGDTEAYRDNLAADAPSLFVVLRHVEDGRDGVRVILVTPAQYEAELHLDNGDDIMEPVPMPDLLVDVLARFVEMHHVERPFIKRQRRRSAP
jgi:hypothetical protein